MEETPSELVCVGMCQQIAGCQKLETIAGEGDFDIGIKCHSVFSSPSQQCISAAILPVLAIPAPPVENMVPDMPIVDGCYGLSPLPKANFSLIWNARERRGRRLRLESGLLRGANRHRDPNGQRKSLHTCDIVCNVL